MRSNYWGKASIPITILFVVFLLHTVPIIGYYFPVYLYWAVVVVLLLSLVTSCRECINAYRKILIVFALPVLSYFIIVVNTPSLLGTYLVMLLELLIYFFMYIYITSKGTPKYRKLFLVFFLILISITSLTTYLGCQIYPFASRDLASGVGGDSATTGIYKSLNIGGFEFIYMIVLTIPMIVGYIKHYRKSLLLGLVPLVLLCMAIIASKYTTAFLLMVLGLFSAFIPKNGSNFSTAKILAIIFFSVVVCGLLLPWFSSLFDNEFMNGRLSDLSSYIKGGEDINNVEGLDARYERWNKSWNSIKTYPLIGSWSQNKIGGHSFMLDSIAEFGLIGLLLLVSMFKRIYSVYLKDYRGTQIYGFALVVFFLSMVLSFLNPYINYQILLFILPLFMYCFQKDANEQNR